MQLFLLADAYIIQVQKYDATAAAAASTPQNVPAKGIIPTTATGVKMTPQVANKKPLSNAGGPVAVSSAVSSPVPVNTQLQSGTTPKPTSSMPLPTSSNTKSPIPFSGQKLKVTASPGKGLAAQPGGQPLAVSLLSQVAAGTNAITQASSLAGHIKTMPAPSTLRGNTSPMIRPPAPGLGPRAAHPLLTVQRPPIPGQTAVRAVSTVAGKSPTPASATPGAAPTQYALVRAQIPGTAGGPPQTVTFIRAISPGGQPASGGATVTVTPQQMAALLRGQTTALKGTNQAQVRNVSPITQGITTAGLATTKLPSTTQAAATTVKPAANKPVTQVNVSQGIPVASPSEKPISKETPVSSTVPHVPTATQDTSSTPPEPQLPVQPTSSEVKQADNTEPAASGTDANPIQSQVTQSTTETSQSSTIRADSPDPPVAKQDDSNKTEAVESSETENTPLEPSSVSSNKADQEVPMNPSDDVDSTNSTSLAESPQADATVSSSAVTPQLPVDAVTEEASESVQREASAYNLQQPPEALEEKKDKGSVDADVKKETVAAPVSIGEKPEYLKSEDLKVEAKDNDPNQDVEMKDVAADSSDAAAVTSNTPSSDATDAVKSEEAAASVADTTSSSLASIPVVQVNLYVYD